MDLSPTLQEEKLNLKLVAVTKEKSVPGILEMLKRTGAKRIGENRLKEAEEKFPNLPKEIEKHFIGKLQSRKIRKIVELFDVIQSLENLEQAKAISKRAGDLGRIMKCMLQINISRLPQRSGAKADEAKTLITEIQKLPNIKLIGVMGMASTEKRKAREEFKLLKSLQANLPECSMGMSDDYQIAIEEGSTMLRLGRILFEENLPNLPNFE